METKLSAITGQTVFSSYSVDTAVTWAGMDGCVWHEKKKNQEGTTLQASQFDNKNIAACKEKKNKKSSLLFLLLPLFHLIFTLFLISIICQVVTPTSPEERSEVLPLRMI